MYEPFLHTAAFSSTTQSTKMKMITLFLFTMASTKAAESGNAHTVDLAAAPTAPPTKSSKEDDEDSSQGNYGKDMPLCFPSTVRVLMADGVSEKQIDALRIGDITATGRVTNWIHREETGTVASDYLLITTGSTSPTVTISSKHMIKINGGFDFAATAEVGDTLEDKDGKKKIISAIEKKKALGKFAPLTTR